MKALFFVAALLMTTSAFAQNENEDNPFKPVEITKPDLRCAMSDEIMEVVFSHSQKKVWLAVDGIKSGLELKVKSYKKAKCPGCFDIKTDFAGAEFNFILKQVGPRQTIVEGTSIGSVPPNGDIVTDKLSGTCMVTK